MNENEVLRDDGGWSWDLVNGMVLEWLWIWGLEEKIKRKGYGK